MPDQLIFTDPIRGADLLGCRIEESGRANFKGRAMTLIVELFGAPAVPAVPPIPATDTSPEIAGVPEIPEVRSQRFELELTDTISDGLRRSDRQVNGGIEKFRKETPGVGTRAWLAMGDGLRAATSERDLLEVMVDARLLPAGKAEG